ncbi:hypothetical protein RBU49_09600 [Clostridium sp. MB40-C1]|uniref:hypothetical protein n=1 Tax=Clostridium sp. MB40-C1 TaxID=3070996 RepID=UPI0027E0DFCF|nr:hypothetical protein [Clostridium sp. MB40-C1]WMJ79146.1 hypothetical protein RBU49_09600 [Clostridium sp. MB40-C1]
MKRKNILTGTILSILIGIGATAYATTTPTPKTNSDNNKQISSGIGLRRITGLRGYDFATSVIKSKLKVTDEDINKAREQGKTLSDFAEEKGLTHENLKAAMIESKNKAIDEAVSKGTISKEEGESYKKKIKESSEKCTEVQGRLNSPKGKGNNQGQGRGNKMNCVTETTPSK